jgi:hypothetical protein
MRIKMTGLKKIITSILVLSMCLSATLITMAGTVDSPAEAKLTKALQFASALSTPAATFTFEFVPLSKDGRDDATTRSKIPAIANQQISFTADETSTQTGNVRRVTKTSNDVLAGLDWVNDGDGAGTYVWLLTEQQSGATLGAGESMDYSAAEFHLVVEVAYASASNSYYAASASTTRLQGDASESATGKGSATVGDSDYNVIFTNIFNKEAGDNSGGGDTNEALVISKTVVDGDNGRDFPFTITLDDSAARHNPGRYTGTIFNGTEATATTYQVEADGEDVSFNLKHGQRLVFTDVPVGTIANVTEIGSTGYTPDISGTMTENDNGSDGENLATGNVPVQASANTVIFTNTYDISNVPTGLLTNNLPFIALIGAGLLVVTLFAIVNKRKAMR